MLTNLTNFQQAACKKAFVFQPYFHLHNAAAENSSARPCQPRQWPSVHPQTALGSVPRRAWRKAIAADRGRHEFQGTSAEPKEVGTCIFLSESTGVYDLHDLHLPILSSFLVLLILLGVYSNVEGNHWSLGTYTQLCLNICIYWQ